MRSGSYRDVSITKTMFVPTKSSLSAKTSMITEVVEPEPALLCVKSVEPGELSYVSSVDVQPFVTEVSKL